MVNSKQVIAGRLAALLLSTVVFGPGCKTFWVDEVISARAGFIARQHGWKLTSGPISIGFPGFCCISKAHTPCHGVPGGEVVEEDDLVKVDVCIAVDGFFADTCHTFLFGSKYKEFYQLAWSTFKTAMQELWRMRRSQLSHVLFLNSLAKRNGVKLIREFAGHEIGREMHGKVLCYDIEMTSNRPFPIGKTFTFEPIMTTGRYSLQMNGKWGVQASRPTIMFEHTILLSSRMYVLTANVFYEWTW